MAVPNYQNPLPDETCSAQSVVQEQEAKGATYDEHRDAVRSGHDCYQCLYDLRDLPKNARCPECGLSISVSLLRTPRNIRHLASLWIIFTILTGCTMSLLWRTMSLSRPFLGYEEYRFFCLLCTLAFAYLSFRFRPWGDYKAQSLTSIAILLPVLMAFCVIILDAWFFEELLFSKEFYKNLFNL